MDLNGTASILQHQACEEEDVGVRKTDLELEGLDEVEDGRPDVNVKTFSLSYSRRNKLGWSVCLSGSPQFCGYGLSLNLLEQLTMLYSIRGLVALIENIRQT